MHCSYQKKKRKIGLNAKSQIMRAGLFEEKEIWFIIHQMKRRTLRVNFAKHCWPLSERKCLLF
jgi:hypothetical protein